MYEPPRYMTVNTAIQQLLEVEQRKGGSGSYLFWKLKGYELPMLPCLAISDWKLIL